MLLSMVDVILGMFLRRIRIVLVLDGSVFRLVWIEFDILFVKLGLYIILRFRLVIVLVILF